MKKYSSEMHQFELADPVELDKDNFRINFFNPYWHEL